MWILPKNLELFPFAQDHLGLKEELTNLEPQSEPSLTWKGRLLSVITWSDKWKQVWWIKHLFGQTLKPSMHDRFAIKYTESLEVIPAREKASQEKEKGCNTRGSFSRILRDKSLILTLFSASSRTSELTYPDLSPTFLAAYKDWVSMLRRDSTRRLKLALHTKDKGFSSLHGPTLTKCGDVWPTPTASRATYQVSPGGMIRLQLPKAVTHWTERFYPTPMASEDQRGAASNAQQSLTSMVATGQLHQGTGNMPTKNPVSRAVRRLNPAWVAQLMGTTLEATFFGCTETEWLSRRQHLRGNHSLQKHSIHSK